MVDRLLDPYVEAIGEFPITGTPAEQLRAAVKYAVLAPSSHNTQPWLFRVSDDHVDLYADRSRGLPVVDPDDRELVISCGAALFQLRLALRHFGLAESAEVCPDPTSPDLLARVTVGGPREPTDEDHALFHAVERRHTTRTAFADRAIPRDLLALLGSAASAEGAWLRVVLGYVERNALADLIARGDRAQMADKHFRRELAAWMRTNRSHSGDGMPGFALGFGEVMGAAGPLVVRTFDIGMGQAARDRDLALGSPVLAVLGTAADGTHHWMAGGQALARVLLRAAVDGVAASFLNQPIELPAERQKVQTIVGGPGYPQLVLRLGYGPETAMRATPRRPLADVMLES